MFKLRPSKETAMTSTDMTTINPDLPDGYNDEDSPLHVPAELRPFYVAHRPTKPRRTATRGSSGPTRAASTPRSTASSPQTPPRTARTPARKSERASNPPRTALSGGRSPRTR